MDIKFNKGESYKKRKNLGNQWIIKVLEYPRRDLNPHAKGGTGF